MNIRLIQVVQAQTDTNSHPTIPFVPPGGNVPTPTPITGTGPIITLSTDKNSYSVGESGKIFVKIDTKSVDIDEFTIIIEFDPSHIQIQDSDSSTAGIQINYLDTHFLLVTDGNKVENNVSGSENSLPGRITIIAKATNDDAITVTNRTIAEINFTVISAKNTQAFIAKNSSTLLFDSVNQLDKDGLQTVTINSSGLVVPSGNQLPSTITPSGINITPNLSIIPGGNNGNGGKTPDTALDTSLGSILVLISGVVLIAAGIHIQRTINSKKR